MIQTIASTSRGCGPLDPIYTEALTWAATLHRSQMRKNTEVPYFAHLIVVSSLVLEDGGTQTEAIAGLLHDAVEDRGIEIAPYLEKLFGDEVLQIVMECIDAKPRAGEEKELWAVRKQKYVDHLGGASLSALRVSAADKLHIARATIGDLRERGA
jgi:(p)ppGpp synthase/HD superfamily hydrolase